MTLADDLVAAVKSRGVQRVYKIGSVPASPGYPYAVVGLTSPEKVARSSDGAAADVHRATIQFFGQTLDGVLDIASKGDLDGSTLADRLVVRELAPPVYRDPDDQGVLAVLHTHRF